MPSSPALPSDVNDRIAALFAAHDLPGQPGAAVLVTRGGEVIHRACHGRASLEFGAPITPGTAFRIASITKQFTCAVALLLAREGRMDLDAEVQSIIPEMTRYDQPVTLRMLMRNVSGVRDSLECLRVAGGGIDIPHTHDETVALICRQSAPNFAPGSSYLYSNANFLLLTEAIQRVTERWLGHDIRERLTEPLGMRDTLLGRSYAEVIPNLATGYVAVADGDGGARFERGVVAKALSGEGGMVSTLDDLALWLSNYRDDRLGIVADLSEPAVFTNGETSRYGHGLVVDSHRGIRVIGHGGLWPGYRSEITYAPDLDIGVVVLANNGAIDPFVMAGRILDIVAADALPPPLSPTEQETVAARFLPGAPFVDPETGDRIGFERTGDVIVATDFGAPVAIEAIDGDTLWVKRASADLRTVRLLPEEPAAIEARYMNGRVVRFVSEKSLPPTTQRPEDVIGRYVNDDLAPIVIEQAADGALVARIEGRFVPRPPMPLTPVGDVALSMDTALGPWMGTNTITLDRDNSGRVTGFRLNSGRLKHIPYRRVG
jgi:D-aminopeptidase